MAVQFPQNDLPRGASARGASDLWDVPQAGVVLSNDWFATASGGIVTGAGTSAATSAVSAAGASTKAADGASNGIATASASGATGGSTVTGDGSSSGVATASAGGNAIIAASGSSAGVATSSATGRSTNAATGASAGRSNYLSGVELIQNWDFSTSDVSGWHQRGGDTANTSVSVVGNALRLTNVSGLQHALFGISFATTIGQTYRFTWTKIGGTQTAVDFYQGAIGNTLANNEHLTAATGAGLNKPSTYYFRANATTSFIFLMNEGWSTAGYFTDYDNVSVQQVIGAAVGASTNAKAGSSSGVATSSAVGSSTASSAGSSAGIATASAQATSIASGAGSSAGIGTASGISQSGSTVSADGSVTAVATVSGAGGAIVEAVGTVSGIALQYGNELISNGTFDTDVSGWAIANSASGQNISWVAGALRVSNGGVLGYSSGSIGFATEIGKAYEFTWYKVGGTNPTAQSNQAHVGTGLGGYSVRANIAGAGLNNKATFRFVAISTTTYVSMNTDGTNAINYFADFDNVSVKQVYGAFGESTVARAGAVTATSTASATSASIAQATGSANGIATVSAQSAGTTSAVGNADGIAVSSGIGRATFAATGLSAGIASVIANGSIIVTASGSAIGQATASAVGQAGQNIQSGAGLSQANSVCSAVGSSTAMSVGLINGSANAAAFNVLMTYGSRVSSINTSESVRLNSSAAIRSAVMQDRARNSRDSARRYGNIQTSRRR